MVIGRVTPTGTKLTV